MIHNLPLHSLLLLPSTATYEAGSSGDENSPQFIVENRAVTLEYARESIGTQSYGQKKWNGEDRQKKETGKSDWLCEQVDPSFLQIFFLSSV
jgi:hypothetical protein